MHTEEKSKSKQINQKIGNVECTGGWVCMPILEDTVTLMPLIMQSALNEGSLAFVGSYENF